LLVATIKVNTIIIRKQYSCNPATVDSLAPFYSVNRLLVSIMRWYDLKSATVQSDGRQYEDYSLFG